MSIKILFLSANPLHTEQLRLDEEVRAIDTALQQARERERFELISHWAVRLDDLQPLFLRHQPDIVHFSGHGSDGSEIILQNAQGEPVIVPADALQDLFKLFSSSIQCVVLNACYSAQQGAAIAEHIPNVIGMSDAIVDSAAINFATAFYRALAYGEDVQRAYDMGLNQIGLTGQEDLFKSRLFTQGEPVNFVSAAQEAARIAQKEADAAREKDIEAEAEKRGPRIGDNANNVIQIGSLNVPRWMLLAISAALIVGVGLILYVARQGEELGQGQAQLQTLLTPTITPTATLTPVPTPTPSMSGSFNVFVADFGSMDADGNLTNSDFGRTLSLAVFDTLSRVYTGVNQDELPRLEIWHDSLGFSDIGMIQGQTASERERDAAAKARSIGADMIIYGNLLQVDDEEALSLDFHFESRAIWTAPDVVEGSYLMGQAIPIPISYESDPTQAKLLVEEPVQVRSQALFWMTVGLSYSIIDQTEKAYDIFSKVDGEIADWQEGDGKEILYYLWGREAKSLRRYDEALSLFEEARRINPQFINAYVGLGQVYFDRAQVFFAQGQELPEDLAKCRVAQNLELGATTLEDALADMGRSIELYDEAMSRTNSATDPTMIAMIQQAMGLSYRLQGQAQIVIAYQNQVAGQPFEADLAEGERLMQTAQAELQATLPIFAQRKQFTLLALSHWGLGNADRMLAHIRLVEAGTAEGAGKADMAGTKRQEAITLLEGSLDQYQTCVDQRVNLPTDLLLKGQIIDCACSPSMNESQAVLDQTQRE